MELPKTYRVRARFGAVSTTGDRDGEITETGVVPGRPLELPTGEIRQRPPSYSAVKVGGERAYRRARRGERVRAAGADRDRAPVRAASPTRASEAEFEIECSSGTYVRSLIADLGDAYCTELRRTAIGPFSVEEADEGRAMRRWPDASAAPRARLAATVPADEHRRHAPARGRRARGREVAIGTFDGVHVGHREVIGAPTRCSPSSPTR